jgi:uncharacterized delta-60 repeat protein
MSRAVAPHPYVLGPIAAGPSCGGNKNSQSYTDRVPACSKCGFESEGAVKFCPECGAEPAAAVPSREQRKTATVLFCDLTGSTALGETLDPERLRALLARYFERMKTIAVRRRTFSVIALACFLIATSISSARAAPGHLDTTFGGDGKVTTDFTKGRADGANDLAIQANGRIVVAGRASGGGARFALARYKRKGALDTTFSGNGKVTTKFTKGNASAEGVAIQADGKIVAAGGNDGRFALARYNADGTLDTTLSGNGKVTTNFTSGSDFASDVAIQADGKIVAAGTTDFGEFALARYNVDGTLDIAFDGDGKVTTDLTTEFDSLWGVAIQADGKIVAAGTGKNKFALARYEADGTLDTTFGGDGKVTTNFTRGYDSANSVAIQSNGKIVLAGDAGFCCEYTGSFGLARYNPDGTLDTTFGGDGKVISNFTTGGDAAYRVAIQADGKIVAAGSAGFNGLGARFALARYKRKGALDTTFSGNGKVTTSFTAGLDSATAVVIQGDGNIVAAGVAFGDVNGMFALARYLA